MRTQSHAVGLRWTQEYDQEESLHEDLTHVERYKIGLIATSMNSTKFTEFDTKK